MIQQGGGGEGFKPNLNYPKDRDPGWRSPFPWVHDVVGRCVKTAILRWGEKQSESANTIELKRNFSKSGLSGEALFHFVCSNFPQFPTYYQYRCGNELTPKIVWDRYHKMFYDNDAARSERGRRSREHPSHDFRLRVWIEDVDKWLLRGTPVSIGEILAAAAKIEEGKLIPYEIKGFEDWACYD